MYLSWPHTLGARQSGHLGEVVVNGKNQQKNLNAGLTDQVNKDITNYQLKLGN